MGCTVLLKKGDLSLNRFAHETLESLKAIKNSEITFSDRKAAIDFLKKETGLSEKDCAEAYDCFLQVDFSQKIDYEKER